MRAILILLSLYAFLFQGFVGTAAADPFFSEICQSQNDAAPLAPLAPAKHGKAPLCCAPCCQMAAITPPPVSRDATRLARIIKLLPPAPDPEIAGTPRPRPNARGPPILI